MSGAEAVEIEIVRLPHGRDLQLPDYATAGAAGADLLAAIDQDIVLGADGAATSCRPASRLPFP